MPLRAMSVSMTPEVVEAHLMFVQPLETMVMSVACSDAKAIWKSIIHAPTDCKGGGSCFYIVTMTADSL